MTAPIRMLVAYSSAAAEPACVLNYLTALKSYTSLDASYVHVTHGGFMDFELSNFDVVFNSYCARHCFPDNVSKSFCEKLKRFNGLKIISVQDDYEYTGNLHRAIREMGFHVLLTSIPSSNWAYGHPTDSIPGVEMAEVLTGYVADDLAEMPRKLAPLNERPIVVGYRGRDLGARYGRLGFEKFEIGRRMKEICGSRGIPCDISMREEDRIYGTAWFDFIGSCRAMLGSESGSNVWDFDGSVAKQFEDMTARLGRRPAYEEFRPFIDHLEAESDAGTISSRIFEAAVMRTPMILFRGRYAGVVEPGEHYLALEKDFSNVDEILRTLNDFAALEALATRAYDWLVASGKFGYRKFATDVQRIIERKLAELRTAQPVAIRSEPDRLPKGEGSAPDYAHERPTPWPQMADYFWRKQALGLRESLESEVARYEKIVGDIVAEIGTLQSELSTMVAPERCAVYGMQATPAIPDIAVFAREVRKEGAAIAAHRSPDDAEAGELPPLSERINAQKAHIEKLSGYFRRLYGEYADSIPILHHRRAQLAYRIELERTWQGLAGLESSEDACMLVRELAEIERSASDLSAAGSDLKAIAAREAAFAESLYGLLVRSADVVSLTVSLNEMKRRDAILSDMVAQCERRAAADPVPEAELLAALADFGRVVGEEKEAFDREWRGIREGRNTTPAAAAVAAGSALLDRRLREQNARLEFFYLHIEARLFIPQMIEPQQASALQAAEPPLAEQAKEPQPAVAPAPPPVDRFPARKVLLRAARLGWDAMPVPFRGRLVRLLRRGGRLA